MSFQPSKKNIAEANLVRHFLGAQRPLEGEDLDNAYSLPGLENPAGDQTGVKLDMIPLLRLS